MLIAATMAVSPVMTVLPQPVRAEQYAGLTITTPGFASGSTVKDFGSEIGGTTDPGTFSMGYLITKFIDGKQHWLDNGTWRLYDNPDGTSYISMNGPYSAWSKSIILGEKDNIDQEGTYSIRIAVWNSNTGFSQHAFNFTIDRTPPTIGAVSVSNITVNSADVNLTSNERGTVYYVALPADAQEPTADQVKAGQDRAGQDVALKGSQSADADTTTTVAVSNLTELEPYKVYLVAEDQAGNLSAVHSEAVTAQDTTAPEAPIITGVTEGTTALSVTPTWVDAPGTTSEATLVKDNGTPTPYMKGTSISDNGSYTLSVTTTKASNGLTSNTTVRFTIDSVPPDTPTITGVTEGQTTAVPVTPIWTDVQGTMSSATLVKGNGAPEPFTKGTPISDNGSYTLSVTTTKVSNGLTANAIVHFTIDSAPPAAPTITGVTEGQTTAVPVTPTWVDAAGTISSATLTKDDGEPMPYTKGGSITSDGIYTLTVTTTKSSNGLKENTTVHFTIDTAPPEALTITGVTEGQTAHSLTPTWTDAMGTASVATLAKDGGTPVPYTKGTPISTEGSYSLNVTTTKTTNGLTANTTVNFTIVPPIVAAISSAAATNGTITVILDKTPTVDPVATDFTATASMNGADAKPLAISGFAYDKANRRVSYTFAPIAQATAAQNVVVAVKYRGKATAAPAFTIAASTPPISPPASGSTPGTPSANGTTPATPAKGTPPQAKPEVTVGPNGLIVKLDETAFKTTQTTEGGKTVANVILNADQLAEAFKSLQTEGGKAPAGVDKIVAVEVKNGGDSMNVQLPASILAEALKATPDAIVAVHTENTSYLLPIRALDIRSLSQAVGVSADEMNIGLVMKKLSGSDADKANKALQNLGASALTTAVDFRITAGTKDKTIEVDHSGGTYAEKVFIIPKAIESSGATAVLVDPNTGEISFVPALFQKTPDGKTAVHIKRSGNSIYSVVSAPRSFDDTSNHWAKADISLLASKLLVKGVSDASFAPDQSVTRAEFAALLVRALGLPRTAANASFSDVQASDWFSDDVATATQAKLVEGLEDGTFRPTAEVTRQEMAVMISRAMAFAGVNGTPSESGKTQEPEGLGKFADQAEIATWARQAFSQMVHDRIIQGKTEQSAAPADRASRAEAVVVLKRFLQRIQYIN